MLSLIQDLGTVGEYIVTAPFQKGTGLSPISFSIKSLELCVSWKATPGCWPSMRTGGSERAGPVLRHPGCHICLEVLLL